MTHPRICIILGLTLLLCCSSILVCWAVSSQPCINPFFVSMCIVYADCSELICFLFALLHVGIVCVYIFLFEPIISFIFLDASIL
jgi:hypothetical protein